MIISKNAYKWRPPRQRRPRQHNDAHLDFIRSLPCIICMDNTATEAAHVRMADPRAAKCEAGMGAKPDDRWCVPLCSRCHREQHKTDEATFWGWQHIYRRIDPIFLALALHSVSGSYEDGMTIIQTYHH